MKQKILSNSRILFLCLSLLFYADATHTMDPLTTTVTIGLTTLSTTHPLASLALTMGKAIGIGIASVGGYLAHKKNSRKSHKCFSPDENNETTNHTVIPCYPLSSIKQMPSQGCQIIVEKHSPGCTLTIDTSIQKSLHFEKEKIPESLNKRYTGPYYSRTEDWIKEHPFGQKIKNTLIRSPYTNQGKRAYKVAKNIESCDGFKKGDYVVVDAMHHDHLEVFGKDKEWKSVANFDGTPNIEKTKQGRKESRGKLHKE